MARERSVIDRSGGSVLVSGKYVEKRLIVPSRIGIVRGVTVSEAQVTLTQRALFDFQWCRHDYAMSA